MGKNAPGIIAIIGQGYVGLPLAMSAVDAGWKVFGIDLDARKIANLIDGKSPVEDIDDERLKSALVSNLYEPTLDFKEVSKANVVAICVPTPLNDSSEPDLSLLESAVKSIARHLTENTLIVSESTSYPGTLRKIIKPLVLAHSENRTKTLNFAIAPERVNPGDKVWNQGNTPRLVGGIDEESLEKAVSFYEQICSTVIRVSSPEVAEAAKLLENTFRLVNIALIDEFTQACSAESISVNEVISSASTKPYGFMPFYPGVGIGGHCIPVDPSYLISWADSLGVNLSLTKAANVVSANMPNYVAEKALSLVQGISNPKVLILGVAYKPGVSDTRETPMLSLKTRLESMGSIVMWHDPLVAQWENSTQVNLDVDYDIAILATNQPGVDLTKLSNTKPILDCTNSGLQGKQVHSL